MASTSILPFQTYNGVSSSLHSSEVLAAEKQRLKKKQMIISFFLGIAGSLVILGILALSVKFIITEPKSDMNLLIPNTTIPEKPTTPIYQAPVIPDIINTPTVTDRKHVLTPVLDNSILDTSSITKNFDSFPVDTLETSIEMNIGEIGMNINPLASNEIFITPSRSPKSVVFVIDYSLSMKGKKLELAKTELSKAIRRLKNGTKYQIIFFGGPYWLAEDKVVLDPKSRFVEQRTTITNQTYRRKGSSWVNDTGQTSPIEVNYRIANDSTLNESIQHIANNPMSLGTKWSAPLKLGLSMEPELIYFMTDGAGGNLQQARQIAQLAEKQNTVINTVAFMIPENVQDIMLEMANLSGGLCTVVDKTGNHKITNLR